MTFQLINPSLENVTATNSNSRIFFLNISAELLKENISVSIDTTGYGIVTSMDIVSGTINITEATCIFFHKSNLSGFPLGNYSLSYPLLRNGNFIFHPYKLYMEVTNDYVHIFQEDQSFDITIYNDTGVSETSDLFATLPFSLFLDFILLATLSFLNKKKRKR